MGSCAFDSALLGGLYHDPEIAPLFTDSAEIRAMMLVEAALAEVQAEAGIIPPAAAAAITRTAHEAQIDPAALAAETATNGVPVPALVAAFRKAMQAPDYAQYLHWGATTQDIMDTGLTLRLRRMLEIMETRLNRLLAALADLAEAHAELPLAARSYGQAATPTSFGAVVASWGAPLLRHRDRLAEMRPRLLTVSLGGASGNLSAMQGKGPELRSGLARRLGLHDPGANWHTSRDTVAELAAWTTALSASIAKMGEDLILHSQTGIGELRLGGTGGSSTMPQKQNPVAPSVLVALARFSLALNGAMQGAALHRQQRDGAAWFTEWLSLPQLCLACGRSLAIATDTATSLTPDPAKMRAGLDSDGLGLIHAEALSFALAAHMPRPEAQAAVKALCAEARQSATPLPRLAAERWPDLGLEHALTPQAQLGTAPEDARAFARAARS